MAIGIPSTQWNVVPPEGIVNKSRQGFIETIPGTLWQLTGPGPAWNNSTTASSLLYGTTTLNTPVTGTTLPGTFPSSTTSTFYTPTAGFLWGGGWPYRVTPTSGNASGHGFKLVLFGVFNTTLTPTLTISAGLRANATTATYTAIATTGAYTTAATTTQPWRLDLDYVIQSYAVASSSPSILISGLLTIGTAATTAGIVLPVGSVAATTSLDMTLSYFPDVVATWGTASASNYINVLGGYALSLD